MSNFDKLSTGLAPYCSIMCEALLVASFPHSSNVNFFENPNKNPAANKSPAPVVSRTSNPSVGGINIELFVLKENFLITSVMVICFQIFRSFLAIILIREIIIKRDIKYIRIMQIRFTASSLTMR